MGGLWSQPKFYKGNVSIVGCTQTGKTKFIQDLLTDPLRSELNVTVTAGNELIVVYNNIVIKINEVKSRVLYSAAFKNRIQEDQSCIFLFINVAGNLKSLYETKNLFCYLLTIIDPNTKLCLIMNHFSAKHSYSRDDIIDVFQLNIVRKHQPMILVEINNGDSETETIINLFDVVSKVVKRYTDTKDSLPMQLIMKRSAHYDPHEEAEEDSDDLSEDCRSPVNSNHTNRQYDFNGERMMEMEVWDDSSSSETRITEIVSEFRKLPKFEIGDIVSAFYTVTQEWRGAEVLKVFNNGYEVYFIDTEDKQICVPQEMKIWTISPATIDLTTSILVDEKDDNCEVEYVFEDSDSNELEDYLAMQKEEEDEKERKRKEEEDEKARKRKEEEDETERKRKEDEKKLKRKDEEKRLHAIREAKLKRQQEEDEERMTKRNEQIRKDREIESERLKALQIQRELERKEEELGQKARKADRKREHEEDEQRRIEKRKEKQQQDELDRANEIKRRDERRLQEEEDEERRRKRVLAIRLEEEKDEEDRIKRRRVAKRREEEERDEEERRIIKLANEQRIKLTAALEPENDHPQQPLEETTGENADKVMIEEQRRLEKKEIEKETERREDEERELIRKKARQNEKDEEDRIANERIKNREEEERQEEERRKELQRKWKIEEEEQEKKRQLRQQQLEEEEKKRNEELKQIEIAREENEARLLKEREERKRREDEEWEAELEERRQAQLIQEREEEEERKRVRGEKEEQERKKKEEDETRERKRKEDEESERKKKEDEERERLVKEREDIVRKEKEEQIRKAEAKKIQEGKRKEREREKLEKEFQKSLQLKRERKIRLEKLRQRKARVRKELENESQRLIAVEAEKRNILLNSHKKKKKRNSTPESRERQRTLSITVTAQIKTDPTKMLSDLELAMTNLVKANNASDTASYKMCVKDCRVYFTCITKYYRRKKNEELADLFYRKVATMIDKGVASLQDKTHYSAFLSAMTDTRKMLVNFLIHTKNQKKSKPELIRINSFNLLDTVKSQPLVNTTNSRNVKGRRRSASLPGDPVRRKKPIRRKISGLETQNYTLSVKLEEEDLAMFANLNSDSWIKGKEKKRDVAVVQQEMELSPPMNTTTDRLNSLRIGTRGRSQSFEGIPEKSTANFVMGGSRNAKKELLRTTSVVVHGNADGSAIVMGGKTNKNSELNSKHKIKQKLKEVMPSLLPKKKSMKMTDRKDDPFHLVPENGAAESSHKKFPTSLPKINLKRGISEVMKLTRTSSNPIRKSAPKLHRQRSKTSSKILINKVKEKSEKLKNGKIGVAIISVIPKKMKKRRTTTSEINDIEEEYNVDDENENNGEQLNEEEEGKRDAIESTASIMATLSKKSSSNPFDN